MNTAPRNARTRGAKEFVGLIPNWRERIIKQAGHMLMYERQPEFCHAARDFLTE